MLQLISRAEVFLRSPFADHHICSCQQEMFERLEDKETTYIDYQTTPVKDAYDHLQPFNKSSRAPDDFAVIAYQKKDREDYVVNCPAAFGQFCKLLDIHKLFLIDELKYDWLLHFPFGSSEKRDALKSIINLSVYDEAFELEIDDLSTLLPLFFYSGRWGVPICYLFPSESSADLLIFLCNDGNFHMAFPATDRELINEVAITAGLKMGGLEICNRYSVRI